MDELLQQIAAYKQEIENQPTNGADSLEAYRIKFLGTKGIVKNLFTEMRNVPADKKKEFGLILNEFKQLAENKYENWKQQLEEFTHVLQQDLTIYPGHGKPADITVFAKQLKYINDFESTVSAAKSREEAMQKMQELYPDYTQADFLLVYSVNAFVAE